MPLDDLLREAEEQFLPERQRTYIVINGTGAGVLIAFLQAIRSEQEATSLAWRCPSPAEAFPPLNHLNSGRNHRRAEVSLAMRHVANEIKL
jgi:hypothetical protein